MCPAETTGFDRLMSLTIAHEYYRDGAGDSCPDFVIEPTGPTRLLMASLGMEMRVRRHGVDIFHDRARAQGLLRYLANRRMFRAERRHQRDGGDGCWTRLSLTLRPRNPLFANFTDAPLGFSPLRHALYLSNQHVDLNGEPAIPLARGWNDHTVMASHGATAGPTLPVAAGTLRLAVTNTSGAVVLQMSRTTDPTAPHHLPSYALGGTGAAAAWASVPMAELPTGLYGYANFAAGGAQIAAGRFLHVAEGEPVFALVDLFLATPGTDDGLYPVTMPGNVAAIDAEAAIGCIAPRQYVLRFAARRTFWVYHVVPPLRGTGIPELRIDADGEAPATFDGPDTAPLPDGTAAWRFSARQALALQSRSAVALRLRGAGRTLLDRLPTASAQLLRLPDAAAGGGPPWPPDPPVHSDIYVYL